MNTSLAVVVPAYNEEASLEKTVVDVLTNENVNLVIIVDNNSQDRTMEIAQQLQRASDRVQVLQESRQGKGNAFKAALEFCRDFSHVGIIDADDTYPANYFDPMLAEAVSRNLDMVVGNRFGRLSSYADNDTRPGHVWGNRLLSHLIKFVSSVEIRDALSGLRVFSSRYIDNFKSMADGFQLETEFSIHCGLNGYAYTEIDIEYKERDPDNPSKLSTFIDGCRIVMFALRHSALTLTSRLGFLVAFLMLFLGVIGSASLLLEFIGNGRVTSVATAVAVSIFFTAGIQILLTSTIENRLRVLERRLSKK